MEIKLIPQSEFTGASYRESAEYDIVYEIYEQKPAKKKGYVYVLMKKGKAYGIQVYCPSTRELGKWKEYTNLGLAIWHFDQL